MASRSARPPFVAKETAGAGNCCVSGNPCWDDGWHAIVVRPGACGLLPLGAFSELGYSLRASFALFTHAIEHFAASGLRFLDLGGGAGVKGRGPDGLTQFKKGWSNGARTVYFCGRIFDRNKYLGNTLAN